MIALKDNDRVRGVKQMARALLEDEYSIHRDAVRRRDWIAVPMESASHLDENDARRITEATTAVGARKLIAVPTEPLAAEPDGYEIEAVLSDLLDFSRTCGHFNFFAAPEGGEFGIVFTVDDYAIVLGPRDAVELIVGLRVSEAREAFSTFANSEEWSGDQRSRLRSVISECDF